MREIGFKIAGVHRPWSAGWLEGGFREVGISYRQCELTGIFRVRPIELPGLFPQSSLWFSNYRTEFTFRFFARWPPIS